MEGDTPKVRSLAGLSAEWRAKAQGPVKSWVRLSAQLVGQTLGRACEMLLLQMKMDHEDWNEAFLGCGLPASCGPSSAITNSMDR